MIYIRWTADQTLCAVSGNGMYAGAYVIGPMMSIFTMFCVELTMGPHSICQRRTVVCEVSHGRNVHTATVENHGISHGVQCITHGSRGMVQETVYGPMVDAMNRTMGQHFTMCCSTEVHTYTICQLKLTKSHKERKKGLRPVLGMN